MRGTGCNKVSSLFDTRRERLSDAERLRLEEHLAGCSICREHNGIVRAVQDVAADAQHGLSDAARQRAISGAIYVVRDERARGSERFGRIPWWWGGAAAAAAAALLGLWTYAGEEPVDGQVASRASASEVAQSTQMAPSEELPTPLEEERVVESEAETSLRFASARVSLSPNSRVRLVPDRNAVVLESGSARFDVDAKEGPFWVETARFRVEVLATRLVVTERSVSVQDGTATVFSPDGAELARELGQGATFTVEEAPREPAPSRKPRAQDGALISARELLRQARGALAEGDVATALRLIERADEAHPARADRAEAGTLRAEAALLKHDPAAAVRAYRSVAARFSDLPAGENALFAAGQVLSRQQDQGAARKAFESYLEAYPRGRFAEEARQRLR